MHTLCNQMFHVLSNGPAADAYDDSPLFFTQWGPGPSPSVSTPPDASPADVVPEVSRWAALAECSRS